MPVSLLLVHSTKTTALLESEQWKWTGLSLLAPGESQEGIMVVISSALEIGFVCAVFFFSHVQNLCHLGSAAYVSGWDMSDLDLSTSASNKPKESGLSGDSCSN